MGTTAVAMEFQEDGTYNHYGAGDSLILALAEDGSGGIPFPGRDSPPGERYERGEICMDDYVESRDRNQLTAFLGGMGLKERELEMGKIIPGITYILCSDGLVPKGYTRLSVGIERAYERIKNISDPLEKQQSLVNFLVEQALTEGSTDNITVVTVRAEKKSIFKRIFT